MKQFFKYTMLLLVPVLAASCNDAGYKAAGIKAYFTDSVGSSQYSATTVEIGTDGTDIELTAALTNSVSSDAVFDLVTDASALESYNAQRSTNFELLPSDYYQMDPSVTIAAGSYSTPVKIHLNPLPQEISSKDMALPVRMKGTGEIDATTVSATHIICIESVDTVKVVPLFSGAAQLTNDKLNIGGTGAFTVEVRFQLNKFYNRNMAVFSHANMLFRFEDPQNPDPTNGYPLAHSQLQFQGTGQTSGYYNPVTPFELDKWQHYAVTWDGKNVRIYVNGK